VVGYSDATLLLSFMHTCAGLPRCAVPCSARGRDAGARATRADAQRSGGLAPLQPASSCRVVEAPLVGGNLKLLQASIGTPWQVDPRGAILFLEEVSEAPYALDRALVHLREAGLLEGVRGVALGQLVRCESERYPGASAGEAVREVLGSASTVRSSRIFPSGTSRTTTRSASASARDSMERAAS
jgi:muramoyltetrapeptide carboxypeptidase